LGVKDLLEGIQRAADVVLLTRSVHEDVVAVGFDPGDVVDGDKEGAFTLADEQALRIASVPLDLLEQMLQTRIDASAIGVQVVDAGTIKSFAEALFNDGLEKIVEGVDFEGAQRILIVCGDEDELREPSFIGGTSEG